MAGADTFLTPFGSPLVAAGQGGATTWVQRESSSEWVTLGALPEFATLLAVPAPIATAQGMPPVVRGIAWAMFVVAGLNGLLILAYLRFLIGVLVRGDAARDLGFILIWGLTVLSVPLRIVIGAYLLRGREWARQPGVYFSIIALLLGAWGILRLFKSLMLPEVWAATLYSPTAMVFTLFSVALFLFNIAVVIVLTRPVVRAAFQAKAKGV